MGCSPWGLEESNMTKQLHFLFSLSCIGEGNGNPLQCSCLENPMDRGAWWAAIYGVAQSRTRLKRLSSSSSSKSYCDSVSLKPVCFLILQYFHSIIITIVVTTHHFIYWKSFLLSSTSSSFSFFFFFLKLHTEMITHASLLSLV